MDEDRNDELLYADEEPNISVLQQTYETTVNDLDEWLQQRQLDYNARRNLWAGKSNDFRKHAVNSETGSVFPFENAADHEVYDIDDHIRSNKVMIMNALRRASINATPVGHDDTERAALTSQYMRWQLNTKMKEFYAEAELAIDNLLEKSIMVTYVYWDHKEQKTKETIDINQVVTLVGDEAVFMSGEADEVLVKYFVEQYSITEDVARTAIDEVRLEGESTFIATKKIRNQPRTRTLMPDEDVFFPPNTIDPANAPYVFLDVQMNTEDVVSRGEQEGWNKEFIEAAIELAQSTQQDSYNYNIRTREKYLEDLNDKESIRITYMYRRLVDKDGVPGIYCTIFARGIEELYGKHELLDYNHGKMPFVATPLERTSRRFYSARSYPEVGASSQQIVKAEMDASLDNLSMRSLPPLTHPPGKKPEKWGPGVQVSVFRPDQYKYADTPDSNPDSYAMREEVRKMASKYFGRADQEADPIEIQNKQQDLIARSFEHFTEVFSQIYSLCQQFGDDEEYFQVIGVNQMQKYTKGDPAEQYAFWTDFDVTTQDPGNMVKRVEGVATLAQQLGLVGQFDSAKLFQIGAGALMPGAANQFLLATQQGQEKAIEEERQAISQLVAGVPPNVRQNDAHQLKHQVFQEWKAQPDVQQMLSQNEALATRAENYERQRVHQLQQQQNAQTGRLGGQDTGFGKTTDL